MRLTTRAYQEDQKAARAGVVWSENMLSDDLDESIRLSQRKVLILSERVDTDELRAKIKDLVRKAHNALLAEMERHAEERMEQLYVDGQKVLEAVGAELRKNYRSDDES
jgi:hypothetical protein